MRKLCFILSFIFIFSMTAFVYAETFATHTTDDSIAVEFLAAYDIPDPASGKSYSYYITRAEIIETVASVFGYKGTAADSVPFTDVTKELGGVLKYALDLNIISAAESFRPSDAVTYNEAIKMCVSALGYEYLASVYGGWPMGYLRVADSIGLSDGLDLSDVNITPSAFYLFVENLLTAEMLEVEGMYDNEISYRRYTTVLKEYFDLYEIEGIVSANASTGLYDAANSTNGDMVVIDGVLYPYDGISYVGYNVRAFASVKNDKISVLSPQKNKTVTVNFGDVVSASESYTEYDSDGKTTKIRLDEDVAYMYNGKADATSVLSSYLTKEGRAVFVDNDEDNVYEVCYLYEDASLVAEGINAVDEYITDKNGGRRINLSDDDMIYNIIQDGKQIPLADIPIGSLVVYNMSKDGLFCELNVYTKQISGVFNQYAPDSKTIYIDDAPYTYSSYFEQNYINLIKLGDSVTLLVSDDNTVYALSGDTKSAYEYGYYIDVKLETGLVSGITVKLMNSEGKIVSCKVSERLVADGRTCSGYDDMQNIFFAGASDVKIRAEQLIRYEINSDGELTLIDFAEGTGTLSGSEVPENNLILWPYPPSGTAEYGVVHGTTWYNRSTHIIHPHLALSPNTVVVLANSDTNVSEDKRFKITDRSWFSLGNNRQIVVKDEAGNFKISAYNVDKYGIAGAIVMDVSANEQVGDGSPSGIIYTVSRAYDEEMNECYKFVIYHGGEFNDYYAYDNSTVIELNPGETANNVSASFDRFERGDFVRFEANEDASLKVILESYDESDKEIYSAITNHGNYNIYYGKIYSAGNNILSILPMNDGLSGNPDTLRYSFPLPTTVTIYDSSNGNIYTSDASELETYLQVGDGCSRAIIATDSGDAAMYIIYK